jgi:ribosome-associated protein
MPTVKSTDAEPDTDNDVSVPGAMGLISKTQLKKASHDLQELGEALVALPDDRLNALPIAESLLDAVREYKRTRSHEGRRRQMQYIGKLMRRNDADPIREAVAGMQLGSAKDTLALHEGERWRAELIADDEALTRWMAEHPKTDAQQLRSLVRNARKDAALVPERRSGRAFRELFQFIKQSAQSTQPHAEADDDV